MDPYIEYLHPLKQRIHPTFIEKLPNNDLWNELKTIKTNPKDEVERLCRLLALQHVFEKAEGDANLRRNMFTGNLMARAAVVGAIREEFEGLSKTLGNQTPVMKFCVQHLPVLSKTYYAKNPTTAPVPLPKQAYTLSSTHYKYQTTSDKGKREYQHALEASYEDLPKETSRHTYFGQHGGHLKSSILLNFKTQLEKTSSIKELNMTVYNMKQTDEYKVLATSQGVFSAITGKTTSSVRAFNKMIEEQRDYLSQHQP